MKKLVRLVILGAILCPIVSIAISCSEEADCSMTARSMVNCILYRVDPETQYVENDTLDSLTVTAYGTDSIIINNQKKVHDISLPLRYTEDSTKLIFKYSRTKSDTMVIRHTNTPYFLSMDCGYHRKSAHFSRNNGNRRIKVFGVMFRGDFQGKYGHRAALKCPIVLRTGQTTPRRFVVFG